MQHIPVTCEQREAMLRSVGCSEMSELFSDVPDEVRLNRPLEIEGGLGEMELVAHVRGLADTNEPASGLV
ncbi:MAG: glycine dehydrogenase, partial [Coriobacteriia bacterium]|nr:glycine dehydrogenase [Coriobacteriia bacterium]